MLVSGQAWPLQKPVALGQAIAAASRDPPGPRRQPAPCTASPAAAAHRDRRHNTEGGLDRVDPGADARGAADGRAPAVFARAAAIASQADTAAAVEVVDAALDHSSHRDRAGGRRITVSTSARTLLKNFRRRWTNWQARLAGHLDLMGTASRSGHAARRGQSGSIRLRQARRDHRPSLVQAAGTDQAVR